MPTVPVTWLDEQDVNTTQESVQNEPEIIQLANGNILIVWTSASDLGAGFRPGTDLIGRIFTPDGIPIDDEFTINLSFFGDNEQDAEIVALPGGGFLVAFEDNETAITLGTSIRLSTHNAVGFLTGSITIQNDTTNGDPNWSNPQIAYSSTTSVLVAYEETSGGTTSVVGRIYNPTTLVVGAQFSLLPAGGSDPSVTALTNGNYVVVASYGGADPYIAYRIVDATGANILSSTIIPNNATNGYIDLEPTVTALTGGGFAIAYTTLFGTDSDVRINTFNAAGGQLSTAFVGLQPISAQSDLDEPVVIRLTDGSIVVIYDNDADDRMEISRYTLAGVYQGTFVTASITVSSIQAISLADGRFAVTFVNAIGEVSMEIFDTRDAPNAPVGTNNVIAGTIGADTINAADGSTVYAGAGDDFVVSGGSVNGRLGDGNDVFLAGTGAPETVDGGAGTDLLDLTSYTGSYTVNLATGVTSLGDSFTNFESVNTGNGDDVITVAALANGIINGGGGNDIITTNGGDTANGGEGNDFIYAGFGPDNLNGGNGIDTVDTSSFSGTYLLNLATGLTTFGNELMINFENAFGGAGDDTFVGTTGNNQLRGEGGYDYLIGGDGNDSLHGGTGTNTLQGGVGNDDYHIQSGDTTLEAAGEGTDYVFANIASHVLQANVENLTSTFAGSFLGIGNALNNIITGGFARRDDLYGQDGNDVLEDGGGANGFEDTLIGGNGNDIYVVGVRGSSTIELAGQGTDEVRTTFSIYGLQANVENLTATDTAAHDALVGNLLSNIIVGSTAADGIYAREGNDTLRGGTGAANTLLGQEGDDLYIVEAAGDSVVEFAGQGLDTVQTALSVFTLGTNVENLTYTGSGTFTGIGSSDGNMLRGGALGDFLSGLDGNDVVIGGGGADTLLGGNGNDQFRYIGSDAVDTIVGFATGQDKIALLTGAFAQTGTVQFQQGAGVFANTANSTFLYDSTTGIISYDADGNGAGAAIQLASIGAGLTLAAGDFVFV